MQAEGVKFRAGVDVGTDVTGHRPAPALRRRRARRSARPQWRDLPVPGRELAGVHQAMEFLPGANRVQEGDLDVAPIDVAGKHVVIIGGGDTGADCLGTSHRQGAASVTQLEIMPMPPESRPNGQPWPTYPMSYKVTSAHEEGGERVYAVNTQRFVDDGNGRVRALEIVEVEFTGGRFEPVPGTERELPADYVFLAMGFTGPERGPLLEQLGVELDERGNIVRDGSYMSTIPGVFVAGDAGRGQSLIVWAIAEGRSAAAGVDTLALGEHHAPGADPADRPAARRLTRCTAPALDVRGP